jgi:hypothetical protein
MVDLTDAGLDVLVRIAGEMWYDDGEDIREAVPALVAEIRAARAAEDVARRIAYAEKARADRAEEDVLALRARVVRCKWCGHDAVDGAGGHTSGCYEVKINALRAQVAELIANGVSVHKAYAQGHADAYAERAALRLAGDDG